MSGGFLFAFKGTSLGHSTYENLQERIAP